MKSTLYALTLLALFATPAPAQDQAQEAPPQLNKAERAQGWHMLFDGTSTDAWRGYRKAGFPKKGWGIVDGTLRHEPRGGGGDIITRRQYGNFELVFEWKVDARANSGVMYLVGEDARAASYMSGPEYQLLDDKVLRDPNSLNSSGALYGLYKPKNKRPKPAGEWNSARIIYDGGRVEHWLNGERVVLAQIGSDDWKSRVANSKFKKWKNFGVYERGHICFQDHGNGVSFRNIKARELGPTKSRLGKEVLLFDGKNLDAWKGHIAKEGARFEDVWSLRDGVLVCAGKPRGYLYTKQSYRDFVLTVVWRWNDGRGGNSGVLLRQNGPHKVWPRSIEAQLQAGNAGDFWNIGKYGMETDRSRLRGRNTKKTHRNEKPLGQWNSYTIICDGPWVRLMVNGEVLNEAWGCEAISGPICLQSEGTEIHFGAVSLRPLASLREPGPSPVKTAQPKRGRRAKRRGKRGK